MGATPLMVSQPGQEVVGALKDRELNQAISKPDTVDRPVRTACTFVHHYTSTQYYRRETVLSIVPFLQTNIMVWSPHYKYLIDKVESVQIFFTKRITGFTELSYTDRLRNLGLETLERRRLAQDLALCYKILFGLCDVSVAVKIADICV